MLFNCFQELDQWMNQENSKARVSGFIPLEGCEILVVGQTALLEAKLDLHLVATADVDVYRELNYSVRKEFERILLKHGKTLDPVGHEAWMPKETRFEVLFSGKWIQGKIARHEYILISKAKTAPAKNKNLLIEYLASAPSESFFQLANRYEIDLGYFVK